MNSKAGWIAASLWLAGAGSLAAAPPVIVTHVAVEPAGADTRLVIETDRWVDPVEFFLPEPQPRFVVDLPAAHFAGRQTGQAPGAALAKGVRYARHSADQSRVVVDLHVPARLGERWSQRIPGGARLSFLLNAAAPLERAAPIFFPAEPGFEPPPAPPPQARTRAEKIVVIDAGHGGHDPGAIGVSGAREKDITLAAARELKAALEKQGGFRVVLTREGDQFLELPERVRLARMAEADLFISLHADAAPNASAKGASVYTLSAQGGARAKRIAGAQDWAVDLGETPRSARAEDILLDLTQRETKSRSAVFAEGLLEALSPTTPLVRNSHRNASFFVLLAPDVPAVLVEMGFLTHAEDEKRLADARRRRAMMEITARAVTDYFHGPATYAGREGAERASFLVAGTP